MSWRSFLFGVAVLVACAMGAWADGPSAAQPAQGDPRQITPYQLPVHTAPLRVPDGQPRYSAQLPPDDVATEAQSAPQDPTPAPTQRVSVEPERLTPPQAPLPQQAGPAVASDTPRYARDPNIERITVSALRQSEDSLYRLGPGDKLRVTIFNETDLSGDFTIDGQGFVRLPLVGQVQAAGLTSFGLESRIAESLVGGGFLVNPRVAVEITGYRPFYILGEVSKPGEYPYVNSMTAPNAVALAGGYTDRAVQSSIYVRHQGEGREQELAADETTRILPGDVVRVRRTTYWTIMTWLSPIISPFATVAYLLK